MLATLTIGYTADVSFSLSRCDLLPEVWSDFVSMDALGTDLGSNNVQ